MHRCVSRVSAAVAIGLAASAATASDDTAPTGRGPGTMTRGVAVFGRAEAALIDALKAGDTAALDRLVAPLFEQRNAEQPGAPVPRAQWLGQAAAQAAASEKLQQLAVHDHGDVVVASYFWQRAEPLGNAFVVDVWKRQPPGEFRLVTRYLSPSTSASAPAVAPADPKK
jgi:hypothetical protein